MSHACRAPSSIHPEHVVDLWLPAAHLQLAGPRLRRSEMKRIGSQLTFTAFAGHRHLYSQSRAWICSRPR